MDFYIRAIKSSLKVMQNSQPHPSPNLNGVCRRTFPEVDCALIDQALHATMSLDGGQELDFERDAEVSFNPRPARVALILIQDAGLRNSNEIAAGILACANNLDSLSEDFKLPSEIYSLATNAQRILATGRAETISHSTSSHAATIIACAHWLDRARHFHLSTSLSRQSWIEFMNRTQAFTTLALQTNPQLHILLKTWHERAQRRTNNENE